MRLAVTLALVASLVAYGAEPGEAISLPKPKVYQLDAPFAVVQRGQTLLELDGGVVMPQASFEQLDQEMIRLQKSEYEHKNEPSPVGWMVAGSASS